MNLRKAPEWQKGAVKSHEINGCGKDDWRQLKQDFSLSLQAVATNKGVDHQKATLFLAASSSQILSLNSFQLTHVERADYETITDKFEEYCTLYKHLYLYWLSYDSSAHGLYVFKQKQQEKKVKTELF